MVDPPQDRMLLQTSTAAPLAGTAMTQPLVERPTWQGSRAALFVTTVVGYWVGLRLAFWLADLSGLSAVFFIPAGITLALLVRTKASDWWIVLVAAGLVEFTSDVQSGLSVVSSIGFTVANTVEPLIGASLMLRWAHGYLGLARRRSVGAFLIGAVVAGPLVGAAIGSIAGLTSARRGFLETAWQWWLGDALGVLVVGGAILAYTWPRPEKSELSKWRLAAIVLLAAIMPLFTSGLSDVPLEFLTIGLVIAAGVILEARGVFAAALVAAVSTAAVLGLEDSPIWPGVSDATAWATIKAQLAVSTIAGLALAAEIYERRAYDESLAVARAERQSAIFAQQVLEQLVSYVSVLTPDGEVVDTNHPPLRADGIAEVNVVGLPAWEAPWWSHDVETQEQLAAAIRRSAEGENVTKDFVMNVAGEGVWMEVQISPLRNDDGTITHLIKSCTDLTERRQIQQLLAVTVASERDARVRTELLGRVAAKVAAAISTQDIVDVVLGELSHTVGLDVGALNVVVGNDVHVFTSTALDGASFAEGSVTALDNALPGPAAIVANEVIILDSTAEITERFSCIHRSVEQLAVRSLAAIPIHSDQSEVSAALVLGSREEGWFDSDKVELLVGIAAQVGQAIERAQLHEEVVKAHDREHLIAARLQDSLLPDRLASHPDLIVGARYLAATETLTVGGDWYDSFQWPDGQLGLMVGDIVGHDLEAAAAMGRLRAALAAVVPLGPPNPARIIEALDTCAQSPDGSDFVTAACVILNPGTSRLAYSTAGHPPPLIVGADGTVEWLDRASSTPSGRLVSGTRTYAEVDFPLGSTLVIYTDGLIESRGADISTRLSELGRSASRLGGTAAAATWIDRLLADLTDGQHRDDVVLLIAHHAGALSNQFVHTLPADQAQLKPLRSAMRAWLARHGVDEALVGDIVLAVGEAVSNSIEHAYEGVDSGTVTVQLHRREDRISASVEDVGGWLKPLDRPNRSRGIPIMRAVSTRFESAVNSAGGTTVTMDFSVPVVASSLATAEPSDS